MTMATSERSLSPQEERDLMKFQRFFAYKFVQVIVQSRLGQKVKTRSKPNAMGYDWFNLAINDIQEVLEETKKITANNQLFSKTNPLCVEVSLTTSEGTSMVLESWQLGMNEKCDNSSKITYMIYNRMGILLKSLICITRVTPAYTIAQNQGHEYMLCYRIYFGKVRISELGDNYKNINIGTIATPKGGITLSVMYKTQLTLPNSSSQSNRVTLQTGKTNTTLNESGMQYPVAMTTEFRQHIAQEIASAVADTDVTNSNLSPQTFDVTMTTTTSMIERDSPGPGASENNKTNKHDRHRTFSGTQSGSNGQVSHGAFANEENIQINSLLSLSSTPPFASLLTRQNKSIHSPNNQKVNKEHKDNTSTPAQSSVVKDNGKNTDVARQVMWEDDFIMVELKAAFAPEISPTTDLTQFYRECQNAPSLDLFHSEPSQPINNIMDNLANQIDIFENNVKNFDKFIADLEVDGKT